MVAIGNFFFRHRNWIFIPFYAALFIPSWPLFPVTASGDSNNWLPIVTGLFITSMGQLIRGLTIGLAYIVRGGKEGRPYAEGLVTSGIFHHCRNPLYLGNILMLAGLGVMANSLLYIILVIPLFLFIYWAMVLAEEEYLRKRFGGTYTSYCLQVGRWIPRLRGLGQTLHSMKFSWKRWVLKEHTTQFIWLAGMLLILLLCYPEFTSGDIRRRNSLVVSGLSLLSLSYLIIRLLKWKGIFRE